MSYEETSDRADDPSPIKGKRPPIVLCLSGHDPTGGAGIQADIETLLRLDCHACTVITALTTQDTHNVQRLHPQPAGPFLEQTRLLLSDLPVDLVKIGLIGSAEIAHAIADLLNERDPLPLILDPILAAGGGRELGGAALKRVLIERLIPRATVVTPNSEEARRLTGEEAPDDCARKLLDLGCQHVLLTGTHESGPDVVNRWYDGESMHSSQWPRLPGSYHGSGCTLASALAGYLAGGLPMDEAVQSAQRFTWESLQRGRSLGQGQQLPCR